MHFLYSSMEKKYLKIAFNMSINFSTCSSD